MARGHAAHSQYILHAAPAAVWCLAMLSANSTCFSAFRAVSGMHVGWTSQGCPRILRRESGAALDSSTLALHHRYVCRNLLGRPCSLASLCPLDTTALPSDRISVVGSGAPVFGKGTTRGTAPFTSNSRLAPVPQSPPKKDLLKHHSPPNKHCPPVQAWSRRSSPSPPSSHSSRPPQLPCSSSSSSSTSTSFTSSSACSRTALPSRPPSSSTPSSSSSGRSGYRGL